MTQVTVKKYKIKIFIFDQCLHYWFQAPGKLPVPIIIGRESFGSFESLFFIFCCVFQS